MEITGEKRSEPTAEKSSQVMNMAEKTPEEQCLEELESPTVEVAINGGPGDDDKDKNFDSSNNSSSSGSSMAKGLSTLIYSVIEDFDSRAEGTVSSQNQLSSALDRLTSELDQLLDDAPLPFIMQHAARISGVRKRVTSLNSVLKSIQRRVDNIDRMLSTGSMQGCLPRQVQIN